MYGVGSKSEDGVFVYYLFDFIRFSIIYMIMCISICPIFLVEFTHLFGSGEYLRGEMMQIIAFIEHIVMEKTTK